MEFTGERVIPEHMKGQIKVYQAHIARYNFALMYARNKKVLDAACGSGYGTDLLYDVAESIVGIDICEQAMELADKKYRPLFTVGDLDDHFPPHQYDIVISFETIEHLDNPEVFLENVRNHSKEFLFSIPINDESKFHKKAYTVEEIEKLIGKYFDEVEWFHQKGFNIAKGLRAKYLIGHAKISART